MRVTLVESLSQEDNLKLEAFLAKFSCALQNLFESQSSLLAFRSFAHVPVVLPYEKPVFLLNSDWMHELVCYEDGCACVNVDCKKAFFLSFDWDHLYQYMKDLESQEFFLQEMGALARLDFWQKGTMSKSLKMPKIQSGKDLLSLVARATCHLIQQEKKAVLREPRFILLLPLAYYAYLREPAGHTSYESIQNELLERLSSKVFLTPVLHHQAILLWEDSLFPSLVIQPVYFVALDKEGKRRIWLYFKESLTNQEIPHLPICFKGMWVKKCFLSFLKGTAIVLFLLLILFLGKFFC